MSRDKTKKEILSYVNEILNKRKKDMEELMAQVNANEINE